MSPPKKINKNKQRKQYKEQKPKNKNPQKTTTQEHPSLQKVT